MLGKVLYNGGKGGKFRKFIELHYQRISWNKDKVNVTYEVLDSNVTFKVSVAKGEMGKIIGKNGLTANAIRGVMQAAGVKDKLNVSVEFLD